MPLSNKEFSSVKEQLSCELLMAKKYHDYAQQVQPELQETLEKLGKQHQDNYNKLLNFLS